MTDATPRPVVGGGLMLLVGAIGASVNKQLATGHPAELAEQLTPTLERVIAPELRGAAAFLLEHIAARLRGELA